MSYSTSAKTVENRLRLLRKLEEGSTCVWYMKDGEDPRMFAYKIREALYAAKYNPQKFPALARAAELFEIKVDGNYVRAVAKRRPLGERVVLLDSTGEHQMTVREEPEPVLTVKPTPIMAQFEPLDAPLHTEPAADEVLTFVGEQSRFSVVALCTENRNSTLHFPEACLDPDELPRLYAWAKAQVPPLMLMTNPGDDALTIGPIDPDVVEFEWRPSDV